MYVSIGGFKEFPRSVVVEKAFVFEGGVFEEFAGANLASRVVAFLIAGQEAEIIS